MDEATVVQSLSALAQEVRLRVFRALVVAGHDGLTPSDMTERVGVSAAALSFHLKALTHAGLITQERQGRHLIYRASFDAMNDLLGYLTENCCQGGACAVPAASACAC